MIDRNLAGRCGLYCGACGVYRAYVDSGEYLEYISKNWNIPKEKIRCNGCQALTPECWGAGCDRVICLDSKGYKFCYECKEFRDHSCDLFESVALRYLERGQDIRESLRRIEAGGADEWLEEQKKRWRCSSCGRPISWYGEKCFQCGKPIVR